jgi:hypothetical protein
MGMYGQNVFLSRSGDSNGPYFPVKASLPARLALISRGENLVVSIKSIHFPRDTEY